MRIHKVGVVGAGVIGRGVAQSLAQTGHRVVLIDVAESILSDALTDVANGLRFAALSDPVLRGSDHAEILSRIAVSTDYRHMECVDFVVENVTEDWNVKEAVYRELDRTCRADCVFAANTSAIRVGRIGATTGRPASVVGLHFMNPVPQKRYVELIVGSHSSASAVASARTLLDQLGKEAILVRDNPGFVSNRVMMLMINEAVAVLEEGVAGASDVDAIFVHCFSHKMGPLATADLIGLDTILRTLDVLLDDCDDKKFEASPLLRRMVKEGRLGRKSGSGFFEYGTQGKDRAHGN
ncbi:3-hydroxyacyl-CoA dehydrogenase family protein [Marilutibacter chinensis]|uniref:3-hydroxyacyl-CoA dehydrogenase NAD-binding domain-containing protein n=1 Tax=Marilutibacter chinensis TaxID=2912247 RepID=A0ABS9HYE6_9GAMM|nr:3-hydroxyacyl-CoA dehydrogenase NAD-binding domain-containing protein [Lysobacter chinensis]MCF7223763.1 3-hydroxyacyl-CoA dehydrogenase NAD-binding domain-containing protein [Lysobacter chinensis]